MVSRTLLASIALVFGLLGGATAGERPRAFLELFTSQGCASCPAADKMVRALDDEDGVFAVTMPVKLWDFLGWADTLATVKATKRQMAYSITRGDRDVYTPQVVLNGVEDLLGNDRAAIGAAIAAHAPDPLPVPIDLSVGDNVLHISVGPAGEAARAGGRDLEASLWMLVVEERLQVPVRGGENRGRKLTYYNVVRQMRPVGVYKGKRMTFDLPLSDVEKGARAGCFVIAQVETFKGPGRIIGAARVDRLFPARTVAR
ncbi:MAG: DUF1223 domain-containing protein [Acuticoccus sp.]